jgi:hypothetical protein
MDMATERARDEAIPFLDERPGEDPITDELPAITAEDIAHFAERLEAGHASGEYTSLRESDLDVLTHLTPEQWEAVKRNPPMLRRILVPSAHA